MKGSEKKRVLVIEVAAGAAALGLYLIYMDCLKYVSPAADDFNNSMRVASVMYESGNNAFLSAWQTSLDVYFNNQGTWSSMLYLYFVMALHKLEIWPYREALFIAATIFFTGMVAFIHALAKNRYKLGFSLPLFLIIMVVSMEHASPGETLYWLTGAAVYTFPIGIGFWAMALFLYDEEYKSIPLLIASCILGFVATGGVLVLAGFMNIVTLLLIVWKWQQDKKLPLRSLIFFASIFVGALVNTIAPGNFVRYGYVKSDRILNITGAFTNTFGILHWQYSLMVGETYFIAGILIACIAVLFMTKKSEERIYTVNPVFMLLGAYLTCYVSLFPSVLGYNNTSDNKYMEIRLAFFTGWIITITSVFAAVYTVLWLRERVTFFEGRTVIGVLALAAVIAVIVAHGNIIKTELGETYVSCFFRELSDGTMKGNYEAMMMIRFLCGEPAPNYVRYEETIPDSEILKQQLLSSDPTWWINQSLAKYYGKDWMAYCPPY